MINSIVDGSGLPVLVSGQSNANAYRCDWSPFTSITGLGITNISVGGYTIHNLVDEFKNNQPVPVGEYQRVLFFVHGETNAYYGTDPEIYISKLYEYFDLLGVEFVLFNLVGRRSDYANDSSFTAIRNRVIEEIEVNNNWFVGFSNAVTFAERGMMVDEWHYTPDGYLEMVNSFIESFNATKGA